MHQFRKGDRVSIEGTVKFGTDPALGGEVYVDLPGGFVATAFKPEALTLVRPHFEPGDRVVFADDSEEVLSVVATSAAHAWLRSAGFEETQGFLAPLRDLQLAPPPPPGESGEEPAPDQDFKEVYETPALAPINPGDPGFEEIAAVLPAPIRPLSPPADPGDGPDDAHMF